MEGAGRTPNCAVTSKVLVTLGFAGVLGLVVATGVVEALGVDDPEVPPLAGVDGVAVLLAALVLEALFTAPPARGVNGSRRDPPRW
jgi:hypothetical protein